MKPLLLLAALLVPAAGWAQVIDLSNLPADFTFRSSAPDGDTTVTYIGQEGDLFKFQFDSPDSREQGAPGYVWTNAASQTVIYEDIDGQTLFDPHDCAPGTGTCEFVATLPDGETYRFLRSAFMLGQIEIGREYLIDDQGNEVLYSASCTTFDEFGFWIDSVRYDFEGVISWDKRQESSIELVSRPSYEKIRRVCEFSGELSS